jgi:predicted nucleotide-binding protein
VENDKGKSVDTIPAMFIGSSSEGMSIARELQAEVDPVCEPTVWSQGVFNPGGTTFSDLLVAAQNVDYAALILTPDDTVLSRGQQRASARDDVIFELGLFLGELGPRRVFLIRPRATDIYLPSDLAGVTVLDYNPHRRDGNMRAAIGPDAIAIRNRIASDGIKAPSPTLPLRG